ncbi:MAG: hypothetical protein GF307_07575 [candidate division Zixibacteria bacterium]|nr:hypothetical protein [candidate division Zixibacteria bacterium]
MQTFLPYPDFEKTAKCLDPKRLGNQRLEAMIILNTLRHGSGWRNHVVVKMWKGHENELAHYMNVMIDEWKRRGYNNNMKKEKVKFPLKMPSWLGNRALHRSHKSNLLRKEPDWYSKYRWNVPDDLPYVWLMP